MTPEHLHILQHALGVNEYGQSSHRPNSDDFHGCYRNRFITSPDCPDGLQCQALVSQGLMQDHGSQSLAGGMHCYTVTDAGYLAMKDASPKPPKISRSKQRFQRYRESDRFFDSFRHFLAYEKAERDATKCGFNSVHDYLAWLRTSA